ncbi:hypothetical protein GYMLUDRAFT_50106 [Collybiopsis luxurians FD-317 M1]|uniref:SET domain-containing protein n=1 Tax=Collybiopsis luxurians FD-317 M1 TaxID=944289 RepID=A0A0D0AP80_9AGAR|nr:hypothetical protein GYMLUDRAFT_50106 [Collybiopsis luxurians FD-317 M1]
MTSIEKITKNVYLEPHPTARERCMASIPFSAGDIILSSPSFVDVLLPAEKGQRCDNCHRFLGSGSLKRCTGCASFFYCDQACQGVHWKSGHRKICKLYNTYISSPSFQALEEHKKMDALLLSNLVAYLSCVDPTEWHVSTPIFTFRSLLQSPMNGSSPPVCPKHLFTGDFVDELYSRFENNNFSIHSHFNTYAHGIFPAASRLFNHSCMPNAAVKFSIQAHEPVKMEIVALRSISQGDEICIPYLDPALIQTRTSIFELTYGFTCSCPSCQVVRDVGTVPEPPEDSEEFRNICTRLREFAKGTGQSPLFTGNSSKFPINLACVLHESFITSLSDKFSQASHDGPYDIAMEASDTLLALYWLIYPPNYPQIGLHLVERAKASWNHIVRSNSTDAARVAELKSTLSSAQKGLTVIEPEGDVHDGPMEDLQTLLEGVKGL